MLSEGIGKVFSHCLFVTCMDEGRYRDRWMSAEV